MNLRFHGITALAAVLFASSALAQVNTLEIEPNSQKSEATLVTGMVSGDTLSGTTTGSVTTLGSALLTTVDMFRLKTAALPLGIYRHRLTVTTTGPVGHIATIRGLNQTGTVGTASTGGTPGTTDTTVQSTATTTVPARFNQWYGFGKQEEIYYRLAGAATTTGSYVATLSTTTVAYTVIPSVIESANPITITTLGQTAADTMIHLFDINLDPIPGASNDDEGPAGLATQSELIRTLPAGTYVLAVSGVNTAWDKAAPADEDTLGTLMDFPGSLVYSSTSTLARDWDFSITGSNGTVSIINQVPINEPYGIRWYVFSTAPGASPIVSPAPANDLCGNATALPQVNGYYVFPFAGATNDGIASCDPGGAASRDMWFTWTNPYLVTRSFGAITCRTKFDTVVAVFDGCNGNELACNDDCGGAPCGGTASCVSGILVAPGQTVWIRVSDKGTTPGATLWLAPTMNSVPLPNDNCATPTALAGPGTYVLDNLAATTGTEGQAEALCNFPGGLGIVYDQWFTYTAVQTGTATVSTCNLIPTGSTPDSKIAIYPFNGAGPCPVPASAIACNDDAGAACGAGNLQYNSTVTFPIICGTSYTIQIGNYPLDAGILSGEFSVTETGAPCGTPFTAYCAGDGTDTACPCGNPGLAGRGCENVLATGGASLSSTGTASISNDTLVLQGANSGNSQFGLFFEGTNPANPTAPFGAVFGNGVRCVSFSGANRLEIRQADTGGSSATTVALSIPGFAVAGTTYYYQLWYRDGVPPSMIGSCVTAGFNFSNAIYLTWGM